MQTYNRKIVFGMGNQLSPLSKKMLILYTCVYVVELFSEHWLHIPIVSFLWFDPFGHFGAWQIFSHPFIHDPKSPIAFLIDLLVLYFFLNPVERAIGSKRFLILFYISAIGGVIVGFLLSWLAGFTMPFMGMTPSLLSIIVVFGLLNPEATVLFMFVLPIKAKYISYGTVVVTLLTYIAKANTSGGYHLGGMLFGYLYLNYLKWGSLTGWIMMRYSEWSIRRKRTRFRVIDGEKNKNGNDRPTIH